MTSPIGREMVPSLRWGDGMVGRGHGRLLWRPIGGQCVRARQTRTGLTARRH